MKKNDNKEIENWFNYPANLTKYNDLNSFACIAKETSCSELLSSVSFVSEPSASVETLYFWNNSQTLVRKRHQNNEKEWFYFGPPLKDNVLTGYCRVKHNTIWFDGKVSSFDHISRGFYEHDLKSGFCNVEYKNGDTYNGQFVDDKFNGKGSYHNKNDNETYVGDFRNGQRYGVWKLIYSNGYILESDFARTQYYKGDFAY
jgi:hypothetical protein